MVLDDFEVTRVNSHSYDVEKLNTDILGSMGTPRWFDSTSGAGDKYRNYLILNGKTDLSNPEHRYVFAKYDPIASTIITRFVEEAFQSDFKIFDGNEIDAKPNPYSDMILTRLKQLKAFDWFVKAGINQCTHGWQVTSLKNVKRDPNTKRVTEVDLSDCFGEHEMLNYHRTTETVRRATQQEVEIRRQQIKIYEDYERMDPKISETVPRPVPLRLNEIIEFRIHFIPQLPLMRGTGTCHAVNMILSKERGEFFHTWNGNYDLGYGMSWLDALWDPIVKIAAESENNYFRQSLFARVILNPDWKNRKNAADDFIKNATYALNNKQILAYYPYVQTDGIINENVPRLEYMNQVNSGQPVQMNQGSIGGVSPEWIRICSRSGFTFHFFTGNPGGAESGADADAMKDIQNLFFRFGRLARDLINPFLKLCQSLGIFDDFLKPGFDFDMVFIKSWWQMKFEAQLLAAIAERKEAMNPRGDGKMGIKENAIPITYDERKILALKHKIRRNESQSWFRFIQPEDYEGEELTEEGILKLLKKKPSIETLEHIWIDKEPTEDEIMEYIRDKPYSLIEEDDKKYLEAEGVNAGSNVDEVMKFGSGTGIVVEFEGEYKGSNLFDDGDVVVPKKILSFKKYKDFKEEESESKGDVHVSDYDRQSGTHVDDYYRSRPRTNEEIRVNDVEIDKLFITSVMFQMGAESIEIEETTLQEKMNALGNFPMVPVASSTVKGMGLRGSDLYVEFHGGKTYDYKFGSPDAAYQSFDDMSKSTSKGGYVWDNLRGAKTGPAWGTGKPTAGGTTASIVPYQVVGRVPLPKMGGYKAFEKEAEALRKFKMEGIALTEGEKNFGGGVISFGTEPDLKTEALGTKRAYYPEEAGFKRFQPSAFHTIDYNYGEPKPKQKSPSFFPGTPKRSGKKGRPRLGRTGFQVQKDVHEDLEEDLPRMEAVQETESLLKGKVEAGQPLIDQPTQQLPEKPRIAEPTFEIKTTSEEERSSFMEEKPLLERLKEEWLKKRQNESELEKFFGSVMNSDQFYGRQLGLKLNELQTEFPESIEDDYRYWFESVNKAADELGKGKGTIYEGIRRDEKDQLRYNIVKGELDTEKSTEEDWIIILNGFNKYNPFQYMENGRIVTEFQCPESTKALVGSSVPFGIYHNLEKKNDSHIPDWQKVGEYNIIEFEEEEGTDFTMVKVNKALVKKFFEKMKEDDWVTPSLNKGIVPDISTAYACNVVYNEKNKIRLQKDFKLNSVSFVPKGNCSAPFCTGELVKLNSASRDCVKEKIPAIVKEKKAKEEKYDIKQVIAIAYSMCKKQL